MQIADLVDQGAGVPDIHQNPLGFVGEIENGHGGYESSAVFLHADCRFCVLEYFFRDKRVGFGVGGTEYSCHVAHNGGIHLLGFFGELQLGGKQVNGHIVRLKGLGGFKHLAHGHQAFHGAEMFAVGTGNRNDAADGKSLVAHFEAGDLGFFVVGLENGLAEGGKIIAAVPVARLTPDAEKALGRREVKMNFHGLETEGFGEFGMDGVKTFAQHPAAFGLIALPGQRIGLLHAGNLGGEAR